MNCEGQDCGQNDKEGNENYELSLADRWIISRLQQAEAAVAEAIANYRFDLASQAIYEFVWNEYCDWYLELSKPVLWDENASPALQKGTRRTLIRVLETTLRMAHPLMPFITEEIWQQVKTLAGAEDDTIMLQPYPEADASKVDEQATNDIEWLKNVIIGIRNIRGEMNISPGKMLPVYFNNGSSQDKQRLENNQQFLSKLAKLDSVTWLNQDEEAPMSATAFVGDMEILVPMAGLIDKDAELSRLNKEAEKLQKELMKVKGKLNNEKFISKAPEEVVAKEKSRLEEMETTLSKLNQQQQTITEL
jgi:valyl-tRNA synthetase